MIIRPKRNGKKIQTETAKQLFIMKSVANKDLPLLPGDLLVYDNLDARAHIISTDGTVKPINSIYTQYVTAHITAPKHASVERKLPISVDELGIEFYIIREENENEEETTNMPNVISDSDRLHVDTTGAERLSSSSCGNSRD